VGALYCVQLSGLAASSLLFYLRVILGEHFMDREDIRLGIRNIKNLPTLPVIVSRILEVADDSGSSANELAELVARDMSGERDQINEFFSYLTG
jgi:hypothetical protein